MELASFHADSHHWGDRPIDPYARNLPALKVRYLLAHLPRSGSVLEIGCGSGRILNTIAAVRPDLRLHGCDLRPLRSAPATFTFRLVSPGARLCLPYEDGSFDAVIMCDALEHLVDPADALKAARNVLRPGGRLVSFTPLEGQRFSFYRAFRYMFGDDLYIVTKEHLQAFSEAVLLRLVGNEFDVVDRAYAYHFAGHFMDAALFACMRWSFLRDHFWAENPYYAEAQCETVSPESASLLSRILKAANFVAYLESRALQRCGLGAAGLLFVGVAR